MRFLIPFVVLAFAGCSVRHTPRQDSDAVRVTLPDRIVDPPPLLAPVDTHETERLPTPAEPRDLPPGVPKPPLDVLAGSLQDAYFDYDRSELTAGALAALRKDAEVISTMLQEFPGVALVVEGHCDERGSAEYNVALGDRRARRAVEVLHENGVPDAALQILSYGKEAPQCTESSEGCRQRNRRVHLTTVRPK
jgi:peptidoglycan-associated lipoprotein